MALSNSDRKHFEIIELRARIGKLEQELKLVRPKPNETYQGWVERLFMRHDYRAAAYDEL